MVNTSISAITCNKEEGPQVWIADELETIRGIRQSSVSDKLYHIADLSYCVGGSGTVAVITRVIEDVLKASSEKDIGYIKDMEEEIKQSYSSHYTRIRDETVMIPNGVTYDEFKFGKIKENRDLTSKIFSELNKFEKDYRTYFLAGGKLSKDKEYRLSIVSHSDVTGGQYFTIGSGFHRADAVISDNFERMKSEERKNIPLPRAVRILIDATQSAWGIPGVGGTGHIAYINKEGFYELASDEVRLLHNLVFDEKTNVLKKSFVNKTIDGIINKKVEVDNVLKQLEKKISHRRLVREHYTGRLQRF